MAGADKFALRGGGKPQASRRGFLKVATAVLSAVVGLILGILFLAALIAPSYRKSRSPFVKVGEVAALPEGRPVSLQFQYQGKDAFIGKTVTHAVRVIKHSDTDLTVFSSICTHLGCHYDWDAAAGQFICPCHDSHFSIAGKVPAGPVSRPLDTLPHKIKGGVLYVRWERFEPGIPRKVLV